MADLQSAALNRLAKGPREVFLDPTGRPGRCQLILSRHPPAPRHCGTHRQTLPYRPFSLRAKASIRSRHS